MKITKFLASLVLGSCLLSSASVAQLPCDPSYTIAINAQDLSGGLYDFSVSGNQDYRPVSWDFGDNSSGIYNYYSNSTAHQYSQPGTYVVCADAYVMHCPFSDSCLISICDTVVVDSIGIYNCAQLNFSPSLTHSFNGNNLSVAHSIPTNSTGLYTVQTTWTYGDGTTTTVSGSSGNHIYSQSGLYLVCADIQLIGSNGGICTYSTCDTVLLGKSPQLICDPSDAVNLTLDIVGNHVSASVAPNFTYSTLALHSGSTTYNTPGFLGLWGAGTHTICAEAWYVTALGDTCIAAECETFTIACNPVNVCDSVGLTALYTSQVNGGVVQFTDQSYTGGYNTLYHWDFGDGTTSSAQSPTHTYTQSGVYTTCLFIEIGPNNGQDSCFALHCNTMQVSVGAQGCDSTSTLSIIFQSIGTHGAFLQTSSNQTLGAVLWDMGDGSNPLWGNGVHTYTYAQGGSYTVCATGWYWDTAIQDTCYLSSCIQVLIGGGGASCDSTAFVVYSPTLAGPSTYFFQSTGTVNFDGYFWTFGDGAFSNSQVATHTYLQPGVYSTCLNAWYLSAIGDTCTSSACTTITVGAGGSACDSTAFIIPTGIYIGNSTIQLGATGSHNFFNYYWDYGDGNSGNNNVGGQYQYAQSGNYMLCVYAWYFLGNGDSCLVSNCNVVNVGGAATQCDSSAYITLFGQNQGLNSALFTTSGNQAFTNYVWNYGDGTGQSSGQSVETYQYAQAGTYTVCVEASYWDPVLLQTCIVSSCFPVTVTTSFPSVCDSIQWNAQYGHQINGLQVDFTDQSNTGGYNANYYWVFGDGSGTSTQQSPSYTYAQAGVYTVCLYLEIGPNSGQDSCFAVYCQTLAVGGATGVCDSTAFISVAAQDLGNNLGGFTTTGSQVFNGYFWTFGDGSGTVSGGSSQTYQYAQAGVYTACVEAWYWDPAIQDTCWVSACTVVTITGGPQSVCDSIVWYAQFSAQATGSQVAFTDQSNTAGYAALYYWVFGDGATSTQQSPTHTYTQPGAYTPCLYVEIGPNNGQDSCFAVYCNTLVVGSGGSCDTTAFISINGQFVGNNTASFTTSGNQNFLGHFWNFGDGSASIGLGATPTYQYAQAGVYTVCVDAWYWDPAIQDTCWVTACDVITVSGGGQSVCDSIQWNALYSYQVNGTQVNFTDQSNTAGYAALYYWDFNDGSSSTQASPSHTYAPGTYAPCLHVEIGPNSGQDSCFAVYCDTITIVANGINEVAADFTVNAYPNPFSNELTIDLGWVRGSVEVELFDTRGRLVHSTTENASGPITINLADLERAMYVVQVQHNGKTSRTRVVRE